MVRRCLEHDNRRRVTPTVLLIWLLTCGIWSTVWLFIKIGVSDVPPVTFAVFRMCVALGVLVPVTAARRPPLPQPGDRALIAATGVVLLGVNYAFLYWGAQYVSSGLTAVLQAMTPVFGFVFAHLLLRDERMTVMKAIALALGVGGVAIVFKDQLASGTSRALAGSAAVVAGAACVAVSYVVMRRRVKHIDPIVITTGQMLSAVVPLLALALLVEGNPLGVRWTRASVLSGLYLAVFGSVLGGWLNYWLLQRIGATKLLSMGLIEPLIAVVLGAVFLSETMTPFAALGGVCILVAVAVVLDLFQGKR